MAAAMAAMAMAEMADMPEMGTLSSESSFSGPPTDASSAAASLTSTPPTTVSVTPDNMSLASEPDISKLDAITVPLLDVIPLLENEQQETGQQTPVGQAIVFAKHPAPAPAPAPTPTTITIPVDPPSTGRARRARASLPVYNLAKLSGTDVHGKRRAKGDAVNENNRRRTISGDTLVNEAEGGADEKGDTSAEPNKAVQDGINALGLGWSIAGPDTSKSNRVPKKPKSSAAQAASERRATRLSGAPVTTLTTTISSLGKRGRKTLDKGLSRMARELKRLQDTNEFAHIDTQPVLYTVWKNGKYVDPSQEEEEESALSPPRKKAKTDDATIAKSAKTGEEEVKKLEPSGPPPAKKRRVKKWLDYGLYAGQETPADISRGLTLQERKKLASIPELARSGKPNKSLPLPMFNGLRILLRGRDFKLPFDVCNPLPPGQPKPAAYRTMTKNRFVGDAAAYWKKTPHFNDFSSKCVCKPEDGCAEDCQNRIMLYECDETNCNVGKVHCQNRAFQNLQERTKKGGRFRVGVELLKTSDRGYGVRSNRCFEPNQIIMEYTGEIITEEECERRMNEVYKDNECYYLMSFDQHMIIDATTGSIARFVNHSCSPNCRMIKWIVSGQPRMALFAGDRPIQTGEELTYDYNFDPFSAKNVQKCLCGSPNCRGVLGPKPKEVKPPKPPKQDNKKKSVKGSVKAGKRKLKELLAGDGDEEDETNAVKKRKIKTAAGLKKSLSSAGLKAAKGAAKGAVTTIKRKVSSISVNAKTAIGSSKKQTTKTTARRVTSTSVLKMYGRQGSPKAKPAPKTKASPKSSGSSTLSTIVAATSTLAKANSPKGSPKKTASANGSPSKSASASASANTVSSRKRTPTWKALGSAQDDGDDLPRGGSPASSVDLYTFEASE
ncbi:hypothetical protein B0T19DRAFT_75476 [Cercophora scortea]|uniref:Histone-lysine N-methyltransferase ASH1L n=1 Tax=Cercophora scortea TaxID=314031 RepID=A0AAE0MM16_9PEZI|nr:hypothetical protein B0T19DRAFT_75476 [Cercophora scortea]